MALNRNINEVGRVAVFWLAELCRVAWAGAERREGLPPYCWRTGKNPPLLFNLGLVANSNPVHCVRLGGFAGYRPDCFSGAADLRGYFNLGIYYLSIVYRGSDRKPSAEPGGR